MNPTAIKPEAFFSESLAEVSVEAERTFVGLLTQADDHGRHRDNAAIIAGLLWPLRAEHNAVHVEDDLQQLANAGLICRYNGCDGRRYLHIATWSEHQKIDKPSQSRLPSCPQHHPADRCAPCKGTCTRHTEASPTPPRGLAETSPNTPRALDLPAQRAPRPPASWSEAATARQDTRVGPDHSGKKAARQEAFAEPSPKALRSLGGGSAPGSRILDPGSSFPTGRTAPAAPVSTNDLIGEYIAACDERPPSDVLMLRSRVNARVSVRRVTEVNAGRVTAGIDREVALLPQEKAELAEWVQRRAEPWKPKPVKRVYIAKANGKRRPLVSRDPVRVSSSCY